MYLLVIFILLFIHFSIIVLKNNKRVARKPRMVKIHVIPSSKEKQNSDLYSKVPNYNMQRLNSVTRPSEVDISKYKSEIGLLKPKTEIDLQQSNTKTELVPNIGVQKYNSKNDLFEIKSAVDDISKPEVDVKIKSELLVPEFDNEINSDIVLPESNLINNENILIETPEVSDENNIAEATTDFKEDKTEIIEDKQDILNNEKAEFKSLNESQSKSLFSFSSNNNSDDSDTRNV
jgi:hypothetical protein